MEFQKLLCCPKVSDAKEPSLQGTRWLGRIIYIIDADTFVIARYINDTLVRYKVRITCIDSAEIQHEKGEETVTPYEQALGALTKSYLLNKMSPNNFKVCTEDVYDWRAQQKVFNKEPIMVMVDCPSIDKEGKKIVLDKYGRELGSVAVLQDESDCTGWDVAQLLIEKELVDRYEGKTKKRSFMKSTTFLDKLSDQIGDENVHQLKTLFTQLPEVTEPELPEDTPTKVATPPTRKRRRAIEL